MAIMATESATSSKKHPSPDERDTARARSGEVDKTTGKKKGARAADERPDESANVSADETVRSPEPASAEPGALDAGLDDLYDNVACTD
jgi:hypothetical protein